MREYGKVKMPERSEGTDPVYFRDGIPSSKCYFLLTNNL